jgi:hypothetical protein
MTRLAGCCMVTHEGLAVSAAPTWPPGRTSLEGIVRGRIGLVALVVLAVGGACTSNGADRSASPAAPTTTAAHHATTSTVVTEPAKTSPKQLSAQFEQLLGQHTLLAVRQMRSVVAAAPDFRRAAEASLEQNTQALSRLVSAAYGGPYSDRFEQLWRRCLADLSAYAEAVAGKDASARQAARAALVADTQAYGAWLADASEGTVKAGDGPAGMRRHAETLMKQVDAYAAGDYDQAYRIGRQAYQQMFGTGASLARWSLTPKLAATLDAPPERLRSAFAMLLGEHMELIIDAQRATFAGSPEFNAAAAQVNANTTAIAQAMGGIVGPRKAAEFQSAWANHVEGLMAYTAAVAAKDEAAKAAARGSLDRFASDLAKFLSGSVQNRLAADLLTNAITTHDGHLIDQADAYAARDYDRAHQVELAGYQQMLGVSNLLVGAIQRTVKPQMPVGGAKTGGGGAAGTSA